jgi:hypothetical protein
MSDYWVSTKAHPDIFRERHMTREIEAGLRERDGLETSLIAAELGINSRRVRAYQRRLGLRKFTGNKRKGS